MVKIREENSIQQEDASETKEASKGSIEESNVAEESDAVEEVNAEKNEEDEEYKEKSKPIESMIYDTERAIESLASEDLESLVRSISGKIEMYHHTGENEPLTSLERKYIEEKEHEVFLKVAYKIKNKKTTLGEEIDGEEIKHFFQKEVNKELDYE